MNEIEEAFNKNFQSRLTKANIYKVICLLLLASLILISLEFDSTKTEYAKYYLKQYMSLNNCICVPLGTEPITLNTSKAYP